MLALVANVAFVVTDFVVVDVDVDNAGVADDARVIVAPATFIVALVLLLLSLLLVSYYYCYYPTIIVASSPTIVLQCVNVSTS